MEFTATLAREFERESHRIDQLIWDAMALRAGESVLFCGFANNIEWIKRAAGIGATVSVVSDDEAAMREFRDLPCTVLRGSTSMLPMRDESYDATVAFHYLHEVDPLFHNNIVAELARVAKRCVIVEPAPPSDPLGLRIASLYSRAKRGLGQFENYHHIDYWRKLVAIVKPDISCQTFMFLRAAPPEAIRDTVSLIIDTMAAEQTPEIYLSELRALAARPDATLLPQARFVIVGAAAGKTLPAHAGTTFRDGSLVASDERPMVAVKPFVPPSLTRLPGARSPLAPPSTVYSSAAIEPEFPAVLPPSTPPAPAVPSVRGTIEPPPPGAGSPASIARNAFGLSGTAESQDTAGDAFGVPEMATGGAPTAEFGWSWEPPDDPIVP